MTPSRLLALDIDGTLCERGRPPTDRSLRAIAEMDRAGWQVVLCTGRRFDRTAPILEGAGLRGHHVVSDGAEVVDHRGVQILAAEIAQADSLGVLARASAADITSVFGVRGRLLSTAKNADVSYLRSYGDPEPEYLGDGLAEALSSEVVTLIYLLDRSDGPSLQQTIDAIQSDLDVAVRRSVSGFATVVASGVSKGQSLQNLLGMYHGGEPFVVAIGDGQNDVPLFELADVSFAMGGSTAEVKASATHLAPSIEADGAALVMEALVKDRNQILRFERSSSHPNTD